MKLSEASKMVEKLHDDILFEPNFDDAFLGEETSQLILVAIGHMEIAQRTLAIAAIRENERKAKEIPL